MQREASSFKETFATSFAQRRLWFLNQLQPDVPLYNLAHGVRLYGELNESALERALQEIVRRHEVLRTTYEVSAGEPVQRIRNAVLEMPREDLSHCAGAEQAERLRTVGADEALKVFDLRSDLMLRARLVRLGNTEHVLYLTLHHIASDGWSIGVLFRELRELYEAFALGQKTLLQELPVQYVDYAAWQREWMQGTVLKRQLGYWTRKLQGMNPVLALPMNCNPGLERSYRGDNVRFELGQEQTRALRRLSQENGATSFMTLLAVFKVLLFRYTGQEDLVVGTPIATRNRVKTEGLIGFFVNLLILRTDLSGQPEFGDYLKQLREAALDAYAHQEMPFEKLVEAINPERKSSQNPLFQVMFMLQNRMVEPMRACGVEFLPFESPTGTARFDVTLSFEESASALFGNIEFSTDLFERSTIKRMADHFRRLVDAVLANCHQKIGRLQMLSHSERRLITVDWNRTGMDFPSHRTVDELFEQQVGRNPDGVAVECKGVKCSYAELNALADSVAARLRDRGVGRESLVGVFLNRSVDAVATVLGTWKAGAAYLPLDCTNPTERLRLMLEDAEPAVVVTDELLADCLPQGIRVLLYSDCMAQCAGQGQSRASVQHEATEGARTACPRVEESAGLITRTDCSRSALPSACSRLAYVLYTSGSTGSPKGVAIEHAALVNFLAAMKRELQFGPQERVLAITTLTFDISGLELYLPLTNGGTVVLADREQACDGTRLRQLLETNGITVLQATPSTWRLLLGAGWAGDGKLKALCGGEPMTADLAAQLRRRTGRLWNVYGPTETTIWSTCWAVDDTPPVRIGKPIGNTRVYVLDENQEPVPVGVRGELYIAGAGVARGYWGQAELTSGRFLEDPFGESGGRMYRTGDMARYCPDGNLEYLGRADQQVKIRGHRIELEEIESWIGRHPGVRNNAVVVGTDTLGHSCLLAYVVCEPAQQATVQALRGFLSERLPLYMVPAHFFFLPELPLTASKKVDRRALMKPDVRLMKPETQYVGPRDPQECKLVRIWEQLFGFEPIGLRDNFFELGGHSLSAVHLFAEIEKATGKRLPLATLFKASTVEQLAKVLRDEGCETRWGSLVPIKPEGSKPPLYLIHAIGGNLLNYRELVRLLGPEQPVYGLQSRGLDGTTSPLTSVEEMSAFYVREICELQPHGPYYLAGTSFGGVLAFEMAQQLMAHGEMVAFLGLMDSAHLQYRSMSPNKPRPLCLLNECLERFRFHSRNLISGRNPLQYVCERFSIAIRRFRRIMRNRTWAVAHQYYQATGRALPRTLYRVGDANYYAIKRYVPRPYPGPITLFKAEELSVAQKLDAEMAWRYLAQGKLEVHSVPGNHVSALLEPHVRTVAAKLQKCLDEARAS